MAYVKIACFLHFYSAHWRSGRICATSVFLLVSYGWIKLEEQAAFDFFRLKISMSVRLRVLCEEKRNTYIYVFFIFFLAHRSQQNTQMKTFMKDFPLTSRHFIWLYHETLFILPLRYGVHAHVGSVYARNKMFFYITLSLQSSLWHQCTARNRNRKRFYITTRSHHGNI